MYRIIAGNIILAISYNLIKTGFQGRNDRPLKFQRPVRRCVSEIEITFQQKRYMWAMVAWVLEDIPAMG